LLELSLHILDILRNSVEAGATRIGVKLEEDLEADWLIIEVTDNGRGMSSEMVAKVLDPFVTTRNTRRVGLGLPLFAEAARQCEGGLEIQSSPGKGTRITARFRHSHWDRAPLGNIVATLMTILLSGTPLDLAYRHRRGDQVFHLDTAEVRAEVGEIPLTHPRLRDWLRNALEEGEAELKKSARPAGDP
jgi:anti-sigma regulatory factor (Ser/Thr protein kinase)